MSRTLPRPASFRSGKSVVRTSLDMRYLLYPGSERRTSNVELLLISQQGAVDFDLGFSLELFQPGIQGLLLLLGEKGLLDLLLVFLEVGLRGCGTVFQLEHHPAVAH